MFSRDVTVLMFVSLNKETAAMLLSPTNPPGIELYITNGKNDNEPNKWNHSVQFCFEFTNKKNSKIRRSSLFKIFRWSQDPFHGRPVHDYRLLDAYTPPRVDVSHCRLVKPTSHKPHNVLLINNWRFVFFRFKLSFDLPTYVNG